MINFLLKLSTTNNVYIVRFLLELCCCYSSTIMFVFSRLSFVMNRFSTKRTAVITKVSVLQRLPHRCSWERPANLGNPGKWLLKHCLHVCMWHIKCCFWRRVLCQLNTPLERITPTKIYITTTWTEHTKIKKN